MLTNKNPNKTDWGNMPLEEMAKGNAMDAYFTLNLFYELEPQLREKGLYDHYERLTSKLIPVFADIELRGMKVNPDKLGVVSPIMEGKIKEHEEALRNNFTEVSPDDNLSSNPTLVEILYIRESGFGLYPPFRSKKTGAPQVDKNAFEVLEALIEAEIERLG